MKLVIAVKLSMCIPHLTSTKESFVTAKKEKKNKQKENTNNKILFFFIDIFDYIIMGLISEIGSWGG